jgi:hypothetical protein
VLSVQVLSLTFILSEDLAGVLKDLLVSQAQQAFKDHKVLQVSQDLKDPHQLDITVFRLRKRNFQWRGSQPK